MELSVLLLPDPRHQSLGLVLDPASPRRRRSRPRAASTSSPSPSLAEPSGASVVAPPGPPGCWTSECRRLDPRTAPVGPQRAAPLDPWHPFVLAPGRRPDRPSGLAPIPRAARPVARRARRRLPVCLAGRGRCRARPRRSPRPLDARPVEHPRQLNTLASIAARKPVSVPRRHMSRNHDRACPPDDDRARRAG